MPTTSTFEICTHVTITEISADGVRTPKFSVPITCLNLTNEEQVETADMIFHALTNGFSELERSKLEK